MSNKIIYFPTHNFFGESENNSGIPFINSDNALSSLINPDEKVINQDTISVVIDFPLKQDFTFTFRSKNGFTRRQVVKRIINQYKKIYEEEEKTTEIPVKLFEDQETSRNTTNGKYGIWEYNMDDLGLDYILLVSDGKWWLNMSS
jgi:hypothetical protein